jgi:HAD superfamily hydrolase (TIGR01490 family)
MRAAFFDLDGTLLRVNSAALWVARERRLGRLGKRQMARAALFFAAYRLAVVDIDAALRAALALVAGVPEEELRAQTQAWWREDVAQHAAPGAFARIEAHRARGDRLVLLTSSSLYASEEAQRQFALDEVLCTRFEVRDGAFTGEARRPYCFGTGKVALAESLAAERGIDLARSSFYTDSYTDLPMLLRVGHPYVVSPDPRLRWEARRRRWPVLDWRSAEDPAEPAPS